MKMNKRRECGEPIRFRMAHPSDIDSLADLRWRLGTADSPPNDFIKKQAFIEAFRSALPKIDNHATSEPALIASAIR